MSQTVSIRCIIAGKYVTRTVIATPSPYYRDELIHTPQASELDISQAIGAAQRAEYTTFEQRAANLLNAASAFTYETGHLEHTARATGLPIKIVSGLLGDIPAWLKTVAETYLRNYSQPGVSLTAPVETLVPGKYLIYTPPSGFAYVVTPATDPRASALAAANLAMLGIPFILKASRHDAVAPLVIQALIDGGMDPQCCNLVYFDNRAANAAALHGKLVQQSTVIWTFGPQASVQAALGLTRPSRDDEKIVIYHANAACASIVDGEFSDLSANFIRQSLAFYSGCTATRALVNLSAVDWIAPMWATLQALRTGDPLDPETDIGYTPPANLDYIEQLIEHFSSQIHVFGGQRLSRFQMQPLLVACQAPLAEFFGQEISAPILSMASGASIREAVALLNVTCLQPPRLAVSIFGHTLTPEEHFRLAELAARTVLIDQPTTTVIPYFHEGNDYLRLLVHPQLWVE